MIATIQCRSLHRHDPAARAGGAEPYLWTVFFKLDGETLTYGGGQLRGTATVVATPSRHGNLRDRTLTDGDDRLVPPGVGTYRTTLQPIRGLPRDVAVIGACVVLLGQHRACDRAIQRGYSALVGAVRRCLNQVIPTLQLSPRPGPHELTALQREVQIAVLEAIRDDDGLRPWMIAIGADDDRLGEWLVVQTGPALLAAGAAGGFRLQQQGPRAGDWEITGSATASAPAPAPAPALLDVLLASPV